MWLSSARALPLPPLQRVVGSEGSLATCTVDSFPGCSSIRSRLSLRAITGYVYGRWAAGPSTVAGKACGGYPTAAHRGLAQSRKVVGFQATLLGLLPSFVVMSIDTQSEPFVPTDTCQISTKATRCLSEDTFLTRMFGLAVRADMAAMRQ